MKNTITFPMLLLSAAVLTACGGSSSSDDDAYVRVLHASPDAPAVDVLIDGKAVLTNVSYQQGSDYLKVGDGTRTVALRVHGTDTIALEADFDLADDNYYSIIAQNNVASLELETLNDTERRNNGSNDVTVVHASPAAGDVDIYVTAADAQLPASPTLDNVSFDQNATLEEIAAGNYQVRITGSSATDVVYNSGTLAISSDVTAVAVNSTKGASPASLLIWAGSVTPVLDATAEVRIVHAVDSVTVDVFAGGNELLGDFAYKDTTIGATGASATGYLTVAAGDLPVAIAAANAGIDSALSNLSGTLTLERGESYTVIAAGDSNQLAQAQLIVLTDNRSASADDAADVRLVHAAAAPAADPVDIYVSAAGDDISTAEPNFPDVEIGTATGYTALDGSTAYDVTIAADGTKTAAISGLTNLTFGDASVTTAIAIGTNALDKIILDDKR
jgi:hypothetical protein